jgi:hypothetical protein
MLICLYFRKSRLFVMKEKEDIEIRTTLRLPKDLLKRVKRYALEYDTTITNVTVKAFEEFLARHSKN